MSLTLDSSTEQVDPRPPRRPPRLALGLAAAAIVIASAVGSYTFVGSRSNQTPTGAISEAAMEDRYGVRVDLVALTALGGLMQLRFTVLDKDKAEKLFHSDKPNLLVEKSGVILKPPTDTAHKMVLVNGGSYFLLYANAANALSTGDKVSVVIDDVRLEHLEVKS